MPSESSFPPVFRDYHGSAKFLTETHPQFQACLRTSYSGFVREPAVSEESQPSRSPQPPAPAPTSVQPPEI
jgi:hypothetical protein